MKSNPEKKSTISNPLLTGFMLLVMMTTIVHHCFGIGVIMSGSMDPVLKKNEVIVISKVGNYAAGDIVVYRSGDQYIVHRIDRIDGDVVTTRGDANNVADDPISRKDIVGVVVGKLQSLPEHIGQGLQAKFMASATGSSRAQVAGWDVDALSEDPDVLQVVAGDAGYGDSSYEFTVRSDSETTAQYHINIALCTDVSDGLILGLFRYDTLRGAWYMVKESSSGELEYGDILPMEAEYARFRLKVRTSGAAAAGNYQACIDCEVTQVD